VKTPFDLFLDIFLNISIMNNSRSFLIKERKKYKCYENENNRLLREFPPIITKAPDNKCQGKVSLYLFILSTCRERIYYPLGRDCLPEEKFDLQPKEQR